MRLVAIALASSPALAADSGFDLTTLMATLSQVRGGEATFTEQRFVRTLDAPLVSSGTLSFSAPDRFSRNTLKPRAESMSVEGNVVTMTRSGRSRTFTLDASPDMAGVVEAVRGTLTGNADLVRHYFQTRLEGDANQWQLTLTPIEARVGAQVRQIQIDGRASEVDRIEMRLADGDYSVMTISPRAK